VTQEKDRVMKALKSLPYVQKVHPSDTNFILFQVGGVYIGVGLTSWT